jgi:hypothetical protein
MEYPLGVMPVRITTIVENPNHESHRKTIQKILEISKYAISSIENRQLHYVAIIDVTDMVHK